MGNGRRSLHTWCNLWWLAPSSGWLSEQNTFWCWIVSANDEKETTAQLYPDQVWGTLQFPDSGLRQSSPNSFILELSPSSMSFMQRRNIKVPKECLAWHQIQHALHLTIRHQPPPFTFQMFQLLIQLSVNSSTCLFTFVFTFTCTTECLIFLND